MVDIAITAEDVAAFKANALAYITHNSPVVGFKFLIEIASPIPQFERWRYMQELVNTGEVMELSLSGHVVVSTIYIRKNTRIEINSEHVSVDKELGYYWRIGHGTEKR